MQHHLRAITEADDVEALRDAIMAGYRALGFHAAYFLAPLPSHRGERILTNVGFPQAWEAEYRKYWHLHDAFPDICLSERHAMIWAEAGGKNLRPDEARYIAKLADWNMQDGVGVVSYGSGMRTGYVGIGLPETPFAIKPPDISLLRVLSDASFARYCDLVIKDAEQPRLSLRESQVLTLIAQGLINREIATRMNVSPDTVDTYCRRIFTKLDVSDRLSAVLSGISHGILKPGDQVMMDSIERRKRPIEKD